jgi:hypothetical protein
MPHTNGQSASAVLTAHEATVQTAQVEIRVMKVGKKQVTMGMFRQLPYEDLIRFDLLAASLEDEDESPLQWTGDRATTLWGHVNYWWVGDYSGDNTYTDDWRQWIGRGERRHIVWESAGVLKRSIICTEVPLWVIQEWGNEVKIRTTWRKIWNEMIAPLPQLFIAV